MGFFVDDHGETYVMVLNADHPSASFPLYRSSGALRLTMDFGSSPTSVDRTVVERFDPDTGMGVLEPLAGLGGTEVALALTLDAGDVMLFKYATGAPFARRP